MKFHGTMRRNEDGMIEVGGVSVETLRQEYGTPLYIFDQEHLETMCDVFKDNFKHERIKGVVEYASKAFLTIAMAQLINQKGLSIDVASDGELYTVYKAEFDMSRVYFHGNNKTMEELELALSLNCGTIIIDNEKEFERLDALAQSVDKRVNVYLRVNPGIDVQTHDYIKTSKLDSKFGVALEEQTTLSLIQRIYESKYLNLKGLHAHIGSQIFQTEPFFENVRTLLNYYKNLENKNIHLKSVNLGGGFGVYYTKGDEPMDLPSFLKSLINEIVSISDTLELNLEEVSIEPGRSIVSNAGSTLYTVGSTKYTPTGKEYVFIDGGMSDNPRVALYQAEYEATIANKVTQKQKVYTIAGKLCESGDILSHHARLSVPSPNDLLLMSSTGAYTFSMSSNYNRLRRPAVVFVKDGRHQCVVKRQTLDDIVMGDLNL